ncbi:MAG: Uncharacterised protein [Flavobacteriaceae bacterium]|jgi:hypothetical protein|nr:MAG: Uncharacterised protein [Flavobacteriaceae bacterium]
MNKKLKEIDFSNMPVSSSLGHLAYGDLAFVAWRKIKIVKNLTKQNAEK